MITINLQYLAVPFVLWSIWRFGFGVYCFVSLYKHGDFAALLGFSSFVTCTFQSFVSLVISWLIWMAFRV